MIETASVHTVLLLRMRYSDRERSLVPVLPVRLELWADKRASPDSSLITCR